MYLKRYRILRFHKDLLLYDTVTEAAVANGLRHMGRLAEEYRALFGQTPTEYTRREKLLIQRQ